MENPAGTVTFLFTDIEGSTRLLAELGEVFGSVLEEHHRLLRDAFARHGGMEVANPGDAFVVAFDLAPAAVAAAFDAQRSLIAQPWPGRPVRVRMGIHTGKAARGPAGWVGMGLHEGARISSAAQGGQILLSEATRSLVESSLPEGASLRDLGSHRLKDLSRPERLLQLCHPDLPDRFPPVRSLGVAPHNLPVQPTAFIGRREELRALRDQLSISRLLTIAGPGGVGKSRLGVQGAAGLIDEYPDGVWLVELAPVADPQLVPQAVASALGISEEPGRDLLATLTDYLRHKKALLFVDNCEHLIDACAQLIDTILRSCPGIHFLATSREALGIAGETSWPLPPMSIPDVEQTMPLDSLAGSDAIQLFLDRALAVHPGFILTEDNAHVIHTICRRIDGLPLAIELAAARVRVMSVHEIAARLDDRFRLLTGGSRTALSRQRTLEATLQWSFQLLSVPEQVLFRRLTVFSGGFKLEAAERVTSGNGIEERDVLDLLTDLVDKSLVVADLSGDHTRYRLLETMRDFARSRAIEAGEIVSLRSDHLRWAFAFAEEAAPDVDEPEWLRSFDIEHDNMRSALEWSLEGGEPLLGLRLATALFRFWFIRNHFREGYDWLERLLAADHDTPVELKAKALYAAGYLGTSQGMSTRAIELLEESVALHRQLGDRIGEAWALHYLARASWGIHDPGVVGKRLEESLAVFQDRDDKQGRLWGSLFLSFWETNNDAPTALTRAEDAYRLSNELGTPRHRAHGAEILAVASYRAGLQDRAGELLSGALHLHRDVGNRACLAHCLEHCVPWLAHGGRSIEAAELLGASEGLRSGLNTPIPPYERLGHDRALAALGDDLGEGVLAKARAKGRALDLDQALALALDALPPS
jgi:predicted ATPase/class 3 adenylate cyclase